MNFHDVLETAAICGLQTIKEAMDNFYSRTAYLIPHEQLPAVQAAVEQGYHAYCEAGNGPDIPQSIRDAAHAQVENHFRKNT